MIDKKIALIIVLIITASSLARFYDISRPTETWDEYSRYVSGLDYMFNIAHLDFSQSAWGLNAGHPPLGKYIYGIVNGLSLLHSHHNIFNLNMTESIRLLYESKSMLPGRYASAVMGILTVLLTFLICYKFILRGNVRFASAAALILALLPAFTANTRLENLDSPAAFFFTLAIFSFLEMESRRGTKQFYLSFAVFTLVTGAAISVKFTNFILLVLIPFYLFLTKGMPMLRNKNYTMAAKKAALWVSWVVLSLVMFVALWPWLWTDPLGSTMNSISPFTSAQNGGIYGDYFLGQRINPDMFSGFGSKVIFSSAYNITYFLATTPAVILALLAIGMLALAKHKSENNTLIVLSFIIPLVAGTLTAVNGVAHILVVYPMAAIISAAGLEKLISVLNRKYATFAAISLIFAYLAMSLAIVHPYYLDYYNEFTGEPGNVYDNKLFIIGWWGEGLSDAANYINTNAPENSTLRIYAEPMHVIPPIRGDIHIAGGAFVPNYVYENGLVNQSEYYQCSPNGWCLYDPEHNDTKADYVLVNTYYEWYINPNATASLSEYEKVYSANVLGAELATVYKMK